MGEILSKPATTHRCAPGWEWREAEPDSIFGVGRYGVPPNLGDYPKGTTWLCECGQVWISEGKRYVNVLAPEFRKESWWERRKRLRR